MAPEVHASAGVTVRIAGRGGNGGVRVLRCDMDALPVREATGLPFASVIEGAMHACGHDLHVAMLLGAAEWFAADPPRHDVVLAFQPGEEADRGAVATLRHANLQAPAGSAFAIHVNAVLTAGQVHYRPGTFMAFGDWFTVTFTGRGGHASAPERTGNPIVAMASLVQELAEVVRELSLTDRVVATVTEVLSGNTVNVIPTSGSLRGTMRSLSIGQRRLLHERFVGIASECASRLGLESRTQITDGYPAVINDPAYLDRLLTSIASALPDVAQVLMPTPSMVIEDFAYFLQRWPGAMVYLGAQVPGRDAFNHSDTVMFDEAVMPMGLALHRLAADL